VQEYASSLPGDLGSSTKFTALGSGRFRVVSLLGEGGLGRVYHVKDVETGHSVALKILHTLRADQLFHLKQEFRSFADIDHSHVVALHELFVDGNEVFFTMELIDGVSFTEYVRESLLPLEPLSARGIKRLEEAIRQLMLGISVLHRAHRLHRDIKPSNVMVSREGRVVVLDFDMGLRIGLDEGDGEGRGFVGTPEYMSPEQVWGYDVSAASDWYAVGVMLYEAIVGELPHTGEIDELIVRKEMGVPEPDRLASCAPRDLADLVMALLSPAAENRAGEREVREYLRNRSFSESLLRDTTGNELVMPFVGRKRELELLQDQYRRAERGETAVMTMEGASGMGKSELIRHFLSKLPRNSKHAPIVLRGRCHPRETVPFRAFDGIIDALSAAPFVKSEVIDAIEHVSALIKLFPVLARIPAISEVNTDQLEMDPFETKKRAIAALRKLLSVLAASRTIVLWIDDLQWGDADSGQLLRELLRPPEAPPVLCILTYREGTRHTSPFLRMYDESRALGNPSAHAVLGLLDPSETEQFARDVMQALGPSASRFIKVLVNESGGHPLLLEELAHEFANATAGAPTNGVLERIWQRRIETLSDAERRILEFVAISGRPMEKGVILQAAHLQEERRKAFARLSRLRLVCDAEVNTRPAVDIYHGRLREVLVGDLPRDVFRERHCTLADTLKLTKAPDPAALVEHYLAAEQESRAGPFAVEAADRAAAALAFDRAAELYALAIRCAVDSRPRWELEKSRADALASDGRSREAAEAYGQAARHARSAYAPSHAVLDLRRRSAEHYLRCGDIEEGRWMLEDVLASVGVPYPASPAAALGTVLVNRAKLWRRGLEPNASISTVMTNDELARIDACWSAGLGLAWVDRMRTAAFQSQFMLGALDSGEPGRVARALATEASQLVSFGGERRSTESARLFRQAEVLARSTKDPATISFVTLMASTMAFYQARWSDAVEHCQNAEVILRRDCRGAAWELTTSHLLRLASLAYLGQIRALEIEVPALVEEAKRRGDKLAAAGLVSGVPNMVWLALDDVNEAQRQAERAMADWPRTDFQTQHYFDLLARTHIDLYRDDAELAWQRLRRAWPQLIWSLNLQVEHFRITLFYLRARAAIALARQRRNFIEKTWLLRKARADAEQLRRQHGRWPVALALLVDGGIAAVDNRFGEAVKALLDAAIALDRLQMPLHAAAARLKVGALRRNDAGSAMRNEASAALIERGVKDPARWSTMVVPGIEG